MKNKDTIQRLEGRILELLGEKHKIPIRHKGEILLVNPMNVIYCQADGNYTIIHLKNGKSILSAKTLKSIQQQFPDNLFFRVHKSYLVNITRIKRINLNGSFYAILSDEIKIKIATSRKKELLRTVYHNSKMPTL
jgi:two-component system LytT family response regulator